jgi:hypothetical protein
LNGLGFSGFEALTGGAATDALVGADTDNTWTISGPNSGDLNGLGFSGFEALTGGAATDTLVASDTDNIWKITGQDAGTLNGLVFTNVENLLGGSGADWFQFLGGSISGLIDGAAGENTFDYADAIAGIMVDLGLATATGAAQFANLSKLTGSAHEDTLTGPKTANDWNVTGANAGDVGGLTFTGIEKLIGGSATDNFIVGPTGSLSGMLSGGGGEDSLTGPDAANTWQVTDADAGTLNGLVFTAIETLIGGLQQDGFTMVLTGFMTGGIVGRAGSDRLRGADNRDNRWLITGTNSGQLNGSDFSGIQYLEGGNLADEFVMSDGGSLAGGLDGQAGDDTLTGPDADTTWNVTGAGSGAVAGIAFSAGRHPHHRRHIDRNHR